MMARAAPPRQPYFIGPPLPIQPYVINLSGISIAGLRPLPEGRGMEEITRSVKEGTAVSCEEVDPLQEQ
jgi:hypothetical protein